MNWEAIGAIGEMLGAAVVFASVVYLALQIRDSSRISQNDALRGTADTWNALFKELANAENSNVILKGLLSYDTLEPSAKFRFDTLMHMLFNTLESTIISVDSEFVVDEVMVNVKSYLNRFFAYPGMFEWWRQSKTEFLVPVQEWVDRRFPRLDPKSDYWGIR